ncbi:MAG: hypothetical protein E6R04_06455 [Spirochaetes bacterium]|nr:MAG: hypothetical protein E6R04_06455 [Spirochaetota bacterium]
MTEDEKAEYNKHDLLRAIRTHIPDFNMATHIMRLVEYALTHPAPQWQPIDTAPRYGTRILCYNAKTGALFVRGGAMVGTPTHWMPLPPLPEKED